MNPLQTLHTYLDEVHKEKQILVAEGIDLKAHIEQLSKLYDKRVKEIADIKRENLKLCKNQKETKKVVKVSVSNQMNMWKDENIKDKGDPKQILRNNRSILSMRPLR